VFLESVKEEEWMKAVSGHLHPGAAYTLVRHVRLVGMLLIFYARQGETVPLLLPFYFFWPDDAGCKGFGAGSGKYFVNPSFVKWAELAENPFAMHGVRLSFPFFSFLSFLFLSFPLNFKF
jgi:hypothetical protein